MQWGPLPRGCLPGARSFHHRRRSPRFSSARAAPARSNTGSVCRGRGPLEHPAHRPATAALRVRVLGLAELCNRSLAPAGGPPRVRRCTSSSGSCRPGTAIAGLYSRSPRCCNSGLGVQGFSGICTRSAGQLVVASGAGNGVASTTEQVAARLRERSFEPRGRTSSTPFGSGRFLSSGSHTSRSSTTRPHNPGLGWVSRRRWGGSVAREAWQRVADRGWKDGVDLAAAPAGQVLSAGHFLDSLSAQVSSATSVGGTDIFLLSWKNSSHSAPWLRGCWACPGIFGFGSGTEKPSIPGWMNGFGPPSRALSSSRSPS